MKRVKFSVAGKWARASAAAPQFTVEAGEVVDLDEETAANVVRAGKGTILGDVEEVTSEEAGTVEDAKSDAGKVITSDNGPGAAAKPWEK